MRQRERERRGEREYRKHTTVVTEGRTRRNGGGKTRTLPSTERIVRAAESNPTLTGKRNLFDCVGSSSLHAKRNKKCIAVEQRWQGA